MNDGHERRALGSVSPTRPHNLPPSFSWSHWIQFNFSAALTHPHPPSGSHWSQFELLHRSTDPILPPEVTGVSSILSLCQLTLLRLAAGQRTRRRGVRWTRVEASEQVVSEKASRSLLCQRVVKTGRSCVCALRVVSTPCCLTITIVMPATLPTPSRHPLTSQPCAPDPRPTASAGVQ